VVGSTKKICTTSVTGKNNPFQKKKGEQVKKTILLLYTMYAKIETEKIKQKRATKSSIKKKFKKRSYQVFSPSQKGYLMTPNFLFRPNPKSTDGALPCPFATIIGTEDNEDDDDDSRNGESIRPLAPDSPADHDDDDDDDDDIVDDEDNDDDLERVIVASSASSRRQSAGIGIRWAGSMLYCRE
jgi:hypothetical protein